MRRVSERVDWALNAEKDDSFMEFKPSDIQLFIDALEDERREVAELQARNADIEKKVDYYYSECDRLEHEYSELKALTEKLAEAFENLKHQNHHTIEEEMWRIDNALAKYKEWGKG